LEKARRCRPRRNARGRRVSPPTYFCATFLGRKRCQCVLAGLLAPPTRLGADPTVLVVMRMALAFSAASATGLDTRLKSYASERGYELGLPGEDVSGRGTDVTAVETQRDTCNEGLDVGIAEVGVGASRAALGTVEAPVDACSQDADLHPERSRMCLEDLLSVGHVPPPLSRPRVRGRFQFSGRRGSRPAAAGRS
jgi:hypothetical protein